MTLEHTRLQKRFCVDADDANDGSGTERPVKLLERARDETRCGDAHDARGGCEMPQKDDRTRVRSRATSSVELALAIATRAGR